MKNTNEMNEFVNRNSLVEGQSTLHSRLSTLVYRLSTLDFRLSTFTSRLSTLVLIVFCLLFGGTAWGQTTLLSENFDNMSISTSYSSSGWYAYNAGNGNNWERSSDLANSGSYSVKYTYNSSYSANCYLVSPPFSVNANMTSLNISLYEMTWYYDSWPEKFEVFFVKANDFSTAAGVVSATHYSAIASATYTNYDDFVEISGSNTNSALAGQSVRAVIHCTSDADMNALFIDDIIVAEVSSNMGDMCAITIELTDAYGDGGGSMQVINSSTSVVLGSYTLGNGSSATYTLNVFDGTPLSFVYASTDSWPYENGYVILDPNGDEVARHDGCGDSDDCDAPNNGEVATYTVNCSACPNPTNLAVNGITTSSATLSWTPGGSEIAWQYSIDDGPWTNLAGVTETTPKTATITGLTTGSAYTVKIRANCGGGDFSNPTANVSFTTSLCDPANMCEITFELTDSYGDGWNGAAIRVTDVATDVVLGEFTNQNLNGQTGYGTNELNTLLLSVCNGREIQFSWVPGSYDDECSYTIKDANDEVIFEGSNTLSTVNYTVNCGSCPKPTGLTASNITGSSADISWSGSASNYNLRYGKLYDFDDGTLQGWTTIDADGDGFNWNTHINTGSGNYTAHSGDGVVYSESYDGDGGVALTPDNWLISPQVQLGGLVSFYAIGQDPDYAEEHFAIYVSNTGTNPSDFTQVSAEFVATGTYVQYTADLSAYSGQGYVAIRHFNVSDMFILNVDDIILFEGSSYISGINSSSYTLTGLSPSTTYVAQVQSDCGGDGTSNWSSTTFTTAFQIATVEHWNQFCGYVNNCTRDFYGETVFLAANIGPVSTMAGTESCPFRGTFEGQGYKINVGISSSEQGAAPFRYISGATIQNLKVDGTVTSTAHHASGLVGFCADGSTNTIQNCLVSTNVTNSNAYDGDSGNNYMGGLIGHNMTATTSIIGCVYDGTLTSQGFKGGIIGFAGRNSTINLTNTYFGGNYSANGYSTPNFSPIGVKSSGRTENLTFSNFYYNTDAGDFTASGYNIMNGNNNDTGTPKHGYTVTGATDVSVAMNGDGTEYGVSGITAYSAGIVYDGTIYGGSGDVLSLSLSGSSCGYEADYGTLSGSSNPYSLTMDAYDSEISVPMYTINTSVNPVGSGSVSGAGTYACGATTLIATANEGYTFTNWTKGGVEMSTNANCSITVNENVTYVANFTLNSYTVSFNANGYGTAPANQNVNHGALVTRPNDPTATGYTFGGWYKESACTNAWNFSTDVVTGPTTLYAKWTANSYQVRFNGNGNTGGSMSNQNFVYGTAQALTANAFTKTGYQFAGWATSADGAVVYTDRQSVSNLTTTNNGIVDLYAKWTINSYTLTVIYEYADHTTAATTYTEDVNYNASYSVTSPTISCYTPDQATVSGTMPANNVTVTVTYNIITYTITVTANAGGSVSGGNTYNCGATATLRATPSDGYCFAQWSDGETANPRNVTVSGAASYTANFTHYLEVSDIATVNYCVTGAHAAVSASPTAGSGGYTYTWQMNNGSWVEATGAANTSTYTPPYSTTGTVSYRVSVADNNGCAGHNSVVKEFSVKVSDVPSIILSASPVCSGNALTLEPTVNNNGKDITSSSYQISANNSDWSSFTNGSTVTVDKNNHYIKYTATNGCGSSSRTVQITVNSLPTASIDGPTSVCALKSETIVASGAGDGGSYSWSNDLGTGASKTVAITSNANYTVTVTDANGCMDDETISMTVKIPGNQPMTHAPEHGAIWTGYVSNVWSNVNNWVYFDGNYRTLEGLSDTLNLILRTGDSDKCILNNPVISSPTFASNSGMIVRRPITIGEGTALNIDGDLNVESGSITLSSTGALLVTGNANIASGASVAFDNKDTLSIAGNLVLEGTLDFPESDTTPALRLGGNLVIDGGSIEEGGTLVFAGSGTQNVSNGASPLTLNNNVRLNMHRSRAGVPHTVFPDGTIFSKTTIFEYGIMDGNVTFDGTGRTIVCGGYESYASGTVTKIGAGVNFTFPTGDDNVLGSITARIALEQNAVAKFHHKATGFTIEDGYPRWWNVADMCGADPFNHVSNFEYWDFNSSAAISDVMFRTAAATAGEHFHSPSEYPDPDNPDNIIQVAVYDECWKNGGGELSITPDFTEITISGVGVEARGTRGSAITSLGSKSKSVVLPIELTSFTATCDGHSALVEWTTATERNNDYFSLERSDDAINFTEIARIAGAGNSIESLDYSYTDYGIHGGDNYYRLVQVDYDGTRTVSDIVVANCIESEVSEPDVLAYPNPFNGELTLVLDNFSNRAATIEVYDMLGKLIYTEKASAPQNSYETVLNLSNLPSGAYTVRVSTTDFVINRNVVKQ